ncbi:hypothetical protein vBVhaSVHB1_78 [Vibrio phage vB_VhaS-VHB1]|nr:hypothetical protein vBVhaSVHB1_78 [Vibrio phage vB_VhaS-VHB1]
MHALTYILISVPEGNLTPKEIDNSFLRFVRTPINDEIVQPSESLVTLFQHFPIKQITEEVTAHVNHWGKQGFDNPFIEVRPVMVRELKGEDTTTMTAYVDREVSTLNDQVKQHINDTQISAAHVTRVSAMFFLDENTLEHDEILNVTNFRPL